jgi:hypothetical protein
MEDGPRGVHGHRVLWRVVEVANHEHVRVQTPHPTLAAVDKTVKDQAHGLRYVLRLLVRHHVSSQWISEDTTRWKTRIFSLSVAFQIKFISNMILGR